MAHEDETLPAADDGPVQRTVGPRAWAVAASFWGKRECVPHMLRAEAEPLYDQAALDTAVAQANASQNGAWRLMCEKRTEIEVERCAAICRARADKMEAEAQRASDAGEYDEASALRATAWQLTVAEREILGA